MPAVCLDEAATANVRVAFGATTTRFTHHDDALTVLDPARRGSLAVVTGFGPTNAPTAGTLSVMLGTIEIQRVLDVPMAVTISDLGAWNSRNVPWSRLTTIRDQMFAFLAALGLDRSTANLRSHLDHTNLVRAGRVARYLARTDFLQHRESLLELYAEHGLLGSEVGVTVDSLYTIADVLEPFDVGAHDVLMVSGMEEAYFTDLARLVLHRQAEAGELSMGWSGQIGALYFRVLEGLGGYPKMSKSIPASSIHLNMDLAEIEQRIMPDVEGTQHAVLSAIELASGWAADHIHEARRAYQERLEEPRRWAAVKADYCQSFAKFARLWHRCGA